MDVLINEPKLDLACGDNKREGFKGIDVVKTESTDYVVDLQVYPWPIESGSVEHAHCSHYIEHIPHSNVNAILKHSNSFEEFKEKMANSKDGLIEFWNELYRILKPGGKASIIAPYYSSQRAYGDPTHERSIADSTGWYLNKAWVDDSGIGHYGLNCDFDVKISYYISNEMTLKSEEVRQKALLHYWNSADDIMIDLIKK